ncbi:MAG: hypothetical protein M0P72_02500 [Metallibacterium scheffleri]|uniref:hypothetical protein n=1 Tax=Metallibacterium scheffleri TaxID=993689 RepID=UPI0026F00DAD|nr:hypothetical protein [Metallibacterium scheffleri]MCK9366003.1 hypothetical protein [Metallibacterium scheffleri]
MRYSESFPHINGAVPKAARALLNLDGVTTYQEIYGVRHPLAAYNISIAHVSRRILKTLDALTEAHAASQSAQTNHEVWKESLLEATDHMLDSLMEHMDDCGGIIRSFFPDAESKQYRDVYDKYKRSVEPYRKYIGNIVNYIKHNQGRLRLISVKWPAGVCIGYYVEGPDGEGILGPAPSIHKPSNTAFSYNRDIPFHLCNVFSVGARLATALHSINKRIVSPQPGSAGPETNLTKVLRRASELKRDYLFDEVNKDVPLIRLHGDGLEIEYPSAKKAVSPPNGSRISGSFEGDGVSRSFRLPYMAPSGGTR